MTGRTTLIAAPASVDCWALGGPERSDRIWDEANAEGFERIPDRGTTLGPRDRLMTVGGSTSPEGGGVPELITSSVRGIK